MDDRLIRSTPGPLPAIEAETERLGFDMPSERRTGAFLRALVAARPGGRLLEIGTGTGLATAWLLDGMDADARLVTIDADSAVSAVAASALGKDPRIDIVVGDASAWLADYAGPDFDLIFADAMAGKYEGFDLAWGHLAVGGQYVADDMLPQANWPKGHEATVDRFLGELEARDDCCLVKLAWASGLMLATRTV